MRKMFMNSLDARWIITVFMLSLPTIAFSQEPLIQEADLEVRLGKVKMYPSLTPKILLKIGYAGIVEPTTLTLDDLGNASTYIVQKVDDSGNVIAEDVLDERIEINSIDTISSTSAVYLTLDSTSIKARDKLKVGIRGRMRTASGDIVRTNIFHNKFIEVKQEDLHTYTLILEPGVVPNQGLTDGNKRTVGRLNFKLDLPSLIPNNVARFYLATDNVISSNGKDKGSRIDFTTGLERSLTNAWYIPTFVETRFLGDQIFKDRSFVLSSGARTILPWAWTRRALFNSFVKAPISPEFEFGLQYERRFKEAGKSPMDKDDMRLFTQIAWNPIHLLTGKEFSPNDISLEILAKGWYFPIEIKSAVNRVRKLEGRYEVSLLLPIKLQVYGVFIERSGSGVNSRVRIKYSDGANEANGFKRSKTLTFAVEAVK